MTDSLISISTPGYDKFEIIQTGVTTLNSPNSAGSSTFVTVSHNLNYLPTVFAFVAFSSNGTRFPIPYQAVNVSTGVVTYQVSMEVTNTDITFYHRDITVGSSLTDYIRYYILRERSD